MQQIQLPASQSNSLFRSNSESLTLFETAPIATFLHQRPFHCSGNYHSCTGDHLTAAATTTPEPAAISLQKQLPVLHQQLPVLHQRPPSSTSRHQRPLSSSRHQQLPVLHQRPPSCTSDYLPAPADTSGHFHAPAYTSSAHATTSPAPATAFLHLRPLSCTSIYQQPPTLHQRLPDLNQWPLSCTSRHQQLPVLKQRSLSYTSRHRQLPVLDQRTPSCTSRYQSCTSDHQSNEYQSCTSYPDLLQRLDPVPTITIRPRRLFAVRFFDLRFAIIKIGLSKQHPCFVILA